MASSTPHPPVPAAGSADQSPTAGVGSADQSSAPKKVINQVSNTAKEKLTSVLGDQSRVDATDLGSTTYIPLTSGSWGVLNTLLSSKLGSSLLLLLLLNFLGITVEEHVDHDVPTVACTGNGST